MRYNDRRLFAFYVTHSKQPPGSDKDNEITVVLYLRVVCVFRLAVVVVLSRLVGGTMQQSSLEQQQEDQQQDSLQQFQRKRKRVAVACVYCRRSKLVCDEGFYMSL